MSCFSPKDLIFQEKDNIIEELKERLSQLPWSPYQDFILRTEEGNRRFEIWVEMLIAALMGHKDDFFRDQERIGYFRAVQGYALENISQVYYHFQQLIWEKFLNVVMDERGRSSLLWNEIRELNYILLQGYSIIASSYLKTREEKITEKVTYLQELQEFTHGIITTFELEKIVNFILQKIRPLFGIEISELVLYRNDSVQEIYRYPLGKEVNELRSIVEESYREQAVIFRDEDGYIFREIDRSDIKRAVSVPIEAHHRCYGTLTLYNPTRGFKFKQKDLDLLYQFLYIAAVALENSFMLKQIEKSHKELRLLTGKMITIQEEERKHLATDIHDTLAQALIGISYKIQYCEEISKKNPELLKDELDDLLKTVHNTIDQSREIISNLRPELIDTMGLVPALQRHITNFENDTGIKVIADLPKKLQISSRVSICLFRVAQEALMNVYKHSEAKKVEIKLEKQNGKIIFIIADNGKGFDNSEGAPWLKNQNRLGLLSIKERIEAVGGNLVINTGINIGCRIETEVPFNPEVS